MAANKFATLIHRKTNRITLILVYAFLEWSLIFFILLNSLFSYFILRFADYFGLKRPCLLCSRLDRFFDASGKSPSHRALLCDDHALEICRAQLFDYSHSKPVEEPNNDFGEFQKDCCLEKTGSSRCAPIESDFGIIDKTQTYNDLIEQSRSIFVFEEEEEIVGSAYLNDSLEERKEEETEKNKNTVVETLHQSPGKFEEEVSSVSADDEEFSCYVSSFDCNKQVTTSKEEENKVDLAMEVQTTPENLEFYTNEEDECHLKPVEFYKPSEEVREISDINGDFILDFMPEGDNAGMNLENDDEETDAEVSIGTEIPDHEHIGDRPSQQLNPHNDDHEDEALEFRTTTNVNEELFMETSSSMESLHNAMFRLERRESLEEELTVDQLKLELLEERKALNALYEELEEERNASAVAANETMAMINRLHEEKAAMQMEALQYQRMMEEQAEFDQEALQLLNELMVNREKENVQLEKELEVCRKRLEEYEVKEKVGMMRRIMRDSSVDSFGDSDENNNGELQNTPVDVVFRLDECLDDYEGERLSILGRLKFLEEKLTALNNEEEEEEDEVKRFENNGNGHFHRVVKPKRLLPLFNEVMENGLGNGNHHENGFEESENGETVTVEEEVDELYVRLEALEADREFLRHCVGSLKKGDKGVHILHEILQHLRDLRNIDLIHVRENGD